MIFAVMVCAVFFLMYLGTSTLVKYIRDKLEQRRNSKR